MVYLDEHKDAEETLRWSNSMDGLASWSLEMWGSSPHLLDCASTKGAIVSFARSLSQALVEKGIRVNAVAPGPIWTPLTPATLPAEDVAKFGSDVPTGR